MENEFSGKRVLVTGAGRGIGKAIALAFGARGAQVVVAARTQEEIESVAREIGDGRAVAIRCDVAQEASVKACTRAAIEAFGGIDIFINSAGIAPSAPLHKMPLEDWNRVLAVNLTGPFLLTKEVLPGMLERKWGRVIHVASIAGKSGMQYVSAYCASKHGLMGMIRATALEVAPKGVTINGICPGYVESPMTDDNVARIAERTGHSPESVRGKMESFSPQRRLIEADEVAASAVYLAGESARGINGQGINICGGSVFS